MSQIANSSLINIKQLAYPCRYHPDEICLNYCIEQKCFQALCSECIEQHLLHHKKTGLNDLYVKSFKSVRSQCSSKLIKIIDKLLAKLSILSQPKNQQEMLQDSNKQLDSIQMLMHQIIDQQFSKVREMMRQKLSQNFNVLKQLGEIHENLIKIINQLKQHNTIIVEGIVDHNVNVGDSIQKTLTLNESALLDMFEKQSWKYDQKFRNINLEVGFNENDFRQNVFTSLKFGNTSSTSPKSFNKNQSMSRASNNDFSSRLRSRSRSPINDRSLENLSSTRANQSSLSFPVLHYFETGQNVLHLIDLKSQPTASSISLGKFKIPTFHASILSQKTGYIFISGGNIQLKQNSVKSCTLSKYSLLSGQFKRQFAEVKPRSSHTLCEDVSSDCIYILGGYGQNLESDDEEVTKFQTSVQKVNMKNGSVEQVPSSKWGGTCIAVCVNRMIIKACMQGIEIFDCVNEFWYQVRNIKGKNLQSVFCRGAGYTLLDPNSILIYGGYDENEQSQNICSLMTMSLSNRALDESTIEVQKIDTALPIAEGFWNNPGIIHQNNVWAIQNMEDEDGQPIESDRTLLRFDIESKRWNTVKIRSNQKKN